MDSIGPVETAKIWEQLNRILENDEFISHERQCKLLTHIVKATLAYDNEALKARNIAIEVFERGEDFNSVSDSVVRTEAAKLRAKLQKYYYSNPLEPLLISIPKGGYSAVFTQNSEDCPENATEPPSDAAVPEAYDQTILIMPFKIVGGKEQAEGLVAGLLNEISVDLTRFYDLNVVDYSFNSYPELGLKLPDMSRHARFVLTGNVQVVGDIFKIWLGLHDSKTNFNIWSDKYEGSLAANSEFDWQESIAESIVYKIAGELGVISRVRFHEYARNPDNTALEQKAFLLYYLWSSSMAEGTLTKALETAETAAASYPENMDLQIILADLHMSAHEYGSRPDSENHFDKAARITDRVLAFSPENQLANLLKSFVYLQLGDIENFIASANRTVEINPINPFVLISLSSSYGLIGKWDIALSYVDKVKKLNPAHPKWAHGIYAIYHYLNGDYAMAYSQALKIHPSRIIWNPLIRLLSSSMLENKEQAKKAMSDLLETYPCFLKNSADILRRMTPDDNTHKHLCRGWAKACEMLGLTNAQQEL